MITDILGAVFLTLGLLFTAVSVIGVFRFDNILLRLHASTIMDTLGLLFTLVGAAFFTWSVDSALKLALIIIFMWVGSPVNSHLIGKMELLIAENLTLNGEEEQK